MDSSMVEPMGILFGIILVILFILSFIRIVGLIVGIAVGLWLLVGRIKNKIILAQSLGNGEPLDRDTLIRMVGVADPIVGGIVGHKKPKRGSSNAPATDRIEPKL